MEDSDYSLADFNTWKVNALKAYLSKRNLKVEGNKATLVAIAFAAWEMKVPLAETNVQLEIEKNQSYQSLLTIGTDGSAVILPDPCKDILPWKSEKEGMKDWPPVYFSNICVFILSRHAGTRMEREWNANGTHLGTRSGRVRDAFGTRSERVFC